MVRAHTIITMKGCFFGRRVMKFNWSGKSNRCQLSGSIKRIIFPKFPKALFGWHEKYVKCIKFSYL